MCLCGMLAAEYETLPEPMQQAVDALLRRERELARRACSSRAAEDGTLAFAGSARDAARTIVGGLEGAMLVARPYGDVARFEAAASHLLTSLSSGARAPAR